MGGATVWVRARCRPVDGTPHSPSLRPPPYPWATPLDSSFDEALGCRAVGAGGEQWRGFVGDHRSWNLHVRAAVRDDRLLLHGQAHHHHQRLIHASRCCRCRAVDASCRRSQSRAAAAWCGRPAGVCAHASSPPKSGPAAASPSSVSCCLVCHRLCPGRVCSS